MKFTYEDVKKITSDVTPDGNFDEWLREIWKFVERDRRNVCESSYEIIGFYRLISEICKLYGGFVNVFFDFGYDDYEIWLSIDYKPLLECARFGEDYEEELEDYIHMLINEGGFSEVRSLLSRVGTDKIFASIYFSLDYEDFSFTDDFDTAFRTIMNEVTADKMAAYEWLKGILG